MRKLTIMDSIIYLEGLLDVGYNSDLDKEGTQAVIDAAYLIMADINARLETLMTHSPDTIQGLINLEVEKNATP